MGYRSSLALQEQEDGDHDNDDELQLYDSHGNTVVSKLLLRCEELVSEEESSRSALRFCLMVSEIPVRPFLIERIPDDVLQMVQDERYLVCKFPQLRMYIDVPPRTVYNYGGNIDLLPMDVYNYGSHIDLPSWDVYNDGNDIDLPPRDVPNDGNDEDNDEDDDDEELNLVPASKSSIEALERVRAEGSASHFTVCSEEISNGSEATRMPCCHLYHSQCTGDWLEISRVRPLCRFEIA